MAVTVKIPTGDGFDYLSSSATSMAVTKPAGLVVGDKMAAIIFWNSGTISAPVGWVAPKSQSGTVAIFTKTADSGDVAASSFTFTTSSSSLGAGAIRALSGVGSLDVSEVGTNSASGSAPTVTPTAQDYFLIMIAHTTAGNQGGSTVSNYAFANDNPTWTEIFDSSRGDQNFGFAIAAASRSALTATGTATVSFSDTKNMVRMFVLGYKETISVPLDIASIASSAPDPVVTGGATFTLDTAVAAMSAPEVNAGQAKWSNQSKNTTSWTNQSKN